MRKVLVSLGVFVVAIAVTIASLSVALAKEDEKGDSGAGQVAVKVAEILGLDAAVVDDAIKQAIRETVDEAIQKKLNALVEKGQLTQEQADGYLNWAKSRPNDIPAMRKHFFTQKHSKPLGHLSKFKSRQKEQAPQAGAIRERLTMAVEQGLITRQEAGERLAALRTSKMDTSAEFAGEDLKRLRAAIEKGEITAEEARGKLAAVRKSRSR